MSTDTYGLTADQYEEFFIDNIRFAAKLYLDTCNILKEKGVNNVDFKTILDMYQEAVYTTNDDCRRYQKNNNPEVLKEVNADLFGMGYPSREDLLEEIKSVNAKVEALTNYIAKLAETQQG